jgi:hypothetical protein
MAKFLNLQQFAKKYRVQHIMFQGIGLPFCWNITSLSTFEV